MSEDYADEIEIITTTDEGQYIFSREGVYTSIDRVQFQIDSQALL